MKAIERRTFVALAGSTILALAGCSSGEPDDATGSSEPAEVEGEVEEAPATATVGEPVELDDMVVTIQSLDHSASYEEHYRYFDGIKSGESVLLLTFILENVSNAGEFDDGSFTVSDYVRLKDESGATLSPMSTAYDYGVYMVAAGGIVSCPVGETVYAGLCYAVPADMAGWKAVVGDTEVPLAVTETE